MTPPDDLLQPRDPAPSAQPTPHGAPASTVVANLPVPRPALVTAGMWITGFWAFAASGVVLFDLLGTSGMTYTMNGAPVSREAFHAGFGFAALVIAVIYCAAVSMSIKLKLAAARPLMVAFWALGVVTQYIIPDPNLDGVQRTVSAVKYMIMGGIAMWYLFGKPNVAAYFDGQAAPQA